MFRRFRRILLIAAAVLVLCVTALMVLAFAYQDEVKAKLVAELNTYLLVPVQQSGIELTLVERFPQASLALRNVFINEVRTDSLAPDTLLYAQDLYLEFSLLSLLRGNYTVSQVHGKGVRLYAGVDHHGVENWLIIRSDSNSSGQTDLKLNKVTFDGLETRYRDARNGLHIRTSSNKLAFRGRFREAGSELAVTGDLHLREWRNGAVLQLSDRHAEVKLKMNFGGADGAFRLEKGSEVLTGEVPVALTMAVERGAKGLTLDLRASGFNMALGDLVDLLPESTYRQLKHYALQGEADVAVHYAGPLEGDGPELSVGMKVRQGRIKEHSSGAVFSDVRGELALAISGTGALQRLLVKGLHATAASGTIRGDVELVGQRQARLKADVQGDLSLGDLLHFARIDTLEEVKGRLKANANITGRLRDVADLNVADLKGLLINGTAELKDASLKLKGVRHRVTELNAAFAIKGNDARVTGLTCAVQGNRIELSGELRNLVPYLLFPDQRLIVDARGNSPRIDLASLFSTSTEETSTTTGDYAVVLPAQIELDLNTSIDELVFEDFTATKIVGTIRLQDRVLQISPLSFTSAQGAVMGSLRLDGRPADAYPLAITAQVEGMDLPKLFHEFRNFGQTFITDAHLKGRGDVRLTLTASLRPSLTLDQQSLHCIADLRIAQGELIAHAPMIAVADYLRTNKLVSPFVDTDKLKERLSHVRFAELENQIEIKDRTVHVPVMLVKSSAMDIEVSGTQTFDGGVDDHLNFRLGDLFKLGAQSDEFGPVVDDGTGIRLFLHMYGTTSDLQFKNDGAAAAARRKDKLKQESNELKNLLGDMWRGKGAAAQEQNNGKAVITLETPGADTTRTSPLANKPKKGLGRLLGKDGKNDDEQEVITIE
jgi:hypothetical protein